MLTRRRNWEEGATAVETAITISVLVTLVFGIIQFGTALWQWNTTLLAVQQAGRYAMINNATVTASDAQTQMQAVLPGATVCTLSGGSINPPTAGSTCVYASTAAGISPAAPTMSLTAVYAYTVIGLTGTFNVRSQATVPLD